MISTFVSLLRTSVKDNTCAMLYLDSTVLDVQKLECKGTPVPSYGVETQKSILLLNFRQQDIYHGSERFLPCSTEHQILTQQTSYPTS